MLQRRHRHEMTQQHQLKKVTIRIGILVCVSVTAMVCSDSFRNYRECEGSLKSSRKDSMND